MSDGTYTQVSYSSPVHYEDENGVYQEIDNRLSVNAMTGKVTTGNGGTNVAFSQSQPQVSINADGHNISWSVEKKSDLRNDDNVSLMNISPSYAPFTANAVNVADTADFKALPAEEQLMSAHKAFSEMKYANLTEGYAINYTVAPGKVKEDILITSAENNEFIITVNATGLTASLGEYRSVIFKNNKNETVLTFDVPYMYDSADEFSTDIDITLTPVIGGYEITLTADEDWLNEEARVYPVVIDPDYIYGDNATETNIIDTMVHTGDTATNCSCGLNHDTNNFVIINKYNSKQYYSYFKFNIESDYAISKVNSASLNLHLTSTTYGDATFRLYRVTQDWNQSTITYSNRPNVDSTPVAGGVSYTATGSGSSRVVTAEFDITQALRKYLAGEQQSYGFMLAYDNESINDYNRFHTVDYATVSWRPQLVMNYDPFVTVNGRSYYINNSGSHKFMSANGLTLESATYHIATGSISNAGLYWTVTHLDSYHGYCGISLNGYHLYDTGTTIKLYYDSDPPNTLDTVPASFQWNIFEYNGYYVIRNKSTGRLLSVSGSTITGATANTGNYQRWYVGYNPCKSIEIENRVAVAGEVIEFDDLGINYNGSGADPSLADDYSFCNATVSPTTAATVANEKITVSPNFTGGEIVVTFGRADTSATAVFSVFVSEFPGTYFIKNVGSGMYVETFSSYARQYGLSGNDSQKWQFEIQTDGSYMIKNIWAGTYLTISSISGYYPAILSGKSAEKTEEQRFYIETDSNGNATIYPKYGEATNAILAAQTTSSGAYIGQGNATSDNRDKWVMQEYPYSVTINCYYDNGYLVRYGETAIEAEESINSYMNKIIERYKELLALEINFQGAEYFQSDIDSCKGTVTTSNIDTLCSHNGIIHTERDNVISDFEEHTESNGVNISIYWSGHKITSTATNGIINENRSCSTGDSIIMIELSSALNRQLNSEGVLFHELNHQFGARNHYHELADMNDNDSCKFSDICSQCGTNPRPSSCSMFDSRQSISHQTIICEKCKNEMLEYLSANFVAS